MAVTSVPNPPARHHYLPECFQRLWAGDDGKIERYTLVHGHTLHVRRVAPAAAGWERNLYRLPGEVDPWAAQKIETEFFAKLDAAAAPIMRRMCDSGRVPRSSEERTWWAMFLLSFLHRTPEHLAATLGKISELNAELMPEVEVRYAEIKGANDPPTFAEWEERHAKHAVERSSLRSVVDLIRSPRAGPYLINLGWSVLDLSNADHRLMVSDNPVILVPLKLQDGHLAMPIGPNHLFIASEHHWLLKALGQTSPRRVVRLVNRLIIERATRLAIASDRSQEAFVRKHFGTCRIGSLATGLNQRPRST